MLDIVFHTQIEFHQRTGNIHFQPASLVLTVSHVFNLKMFSPQIYENRPNLPLKASFILFFPRYFNQSGPLLKEKPYICIHDESCSPKQSKQHECPRNQQ